MNKPVSSSMRKRSLRQQWRNTSSLGLESNVGFVNNTLGDLYLQEAKYDDARQAYSEGSKVPELHAWSEASLVNLDLQQGRSTAADLLGRIDAAIQEAKDAEDKESESFARVIKARVLLQLRRRDEAGAQAEKARDLARETQTTRQRAGRKNRARGN